MDTFLQLCQSRYSVRKYSDEPVAESDLNYVLECVRIAPSGVNFQPWKFVVVKSEENRKKLQQCYDREWFNTAPIYIIAYKDTDKERVRKYDGKHIGDIDVAIAVEHLCLAATEKGLGTCWVCNFNPQLLCELFPQTPNYVPVAIVPIGHIAPDCQKRVQGRKELSEIVETI